MESLESVRAILRHRSRQDLADLLDHSNVDYDESTQYGTQLFSRLTTAEIYSPIEDYDRLRNISQANRKAILSAFLEIYPPRAYEMEINWIEFRLDSTKLKEPCLNNDSLIIEVEAQRSLMISVSTGGPRIDQVNEQYISRRNLIKKGLVNRKISDPNPYNDLWAWYGKWSSGDLPTYQSRRIYLSELYKPLIEKLQMSSTNPPNQLFEAPTGWNVIDRDMGEIRTLLEQAQTTQQFQMVGLACRELLISIAQTVYIKARHMSAVDKEPSETDAKRMLDAYIVVELKGGPNEQLRKYARASLDLANVLQHRRTATFRDAALCAEATLSVINFIAIVSGQRNP